MNGWCRSVLLIFLICPIALAQDNDRAASQPGIAKPDTGSISHGIYTNDFFGFSYPLPDGWYENIELRETAHLPEGSLLLFVADQHTGRLLRNRLLVIADDESRYLRYHPAPNVRDYVAKMVHTQIDKEGKRLAQGAVAVEMSGKYFFRADYKESSDIATLYKAFVCMDAKGYFLSWTFVADSQERLDLLVNSLDHISFREDQQQRPRTPSASMAPLPPSTLKRPRRVRVSELVSQSLLLKKTQPVYPDEARKEHIEGAVVMRGLISPSGDIKELTLISGHPSLASAAMEAVRQWQYKPYELLGQPVEVETQITVLFQLSKH
jgi:TonB family protein